MFAALLLSTLLAADAAPPPPPSLTAAAAPRPAPAPADVAAPPADATVTASGLAYKILSPGPAGDDQHPRANSRVTVHYTGWQTDGTMFDSSILQGQPVTFALNGVIAGWTEGVQLLRRGDKARLWIPERLAYQGRDPKGMLVFDIELLDFLTLPPTPLDVSGPGRAAVATGTGLFTRVLQAGTGAVKPTANAEVTLHFSAWTTAGQLLDTTAVRKGPAKLPMSEVIPGWREALTLMVAGERRRVWVPAHLGGDGTDEMLVFDLELVAIHEPAVQAPAAP